MLSEELWRTQTGIIGLMSEALQEVLTAQWFAESAQDRIEWMYWAVEQVLKAADPRPGAEMGDYPHNLRAYCPLCKRGAMVAYSRGFSFPIGLERHLIGSHNIVQCAVFRAAEQMCIQRLREREKRGDLEPKWTKHTPPWKAPAPDERPVAEVIPISLRRP